MRLNEFSTTSHHQGHMTLTHRSSFVGQGPKAFAEKASGTHHRPSTRFPGILPSCCAQENGMVTALGLLMLAVLTLLGTTAVVVTSTDIQIGGNYKASETAFYAAEAGVEEARARLRDGAVGKINDTAPTSPTWKAYIGTPDAPSLQPDPVNIKYVVEIRHKPDPNDLNKVMTTPTGNNIYIVTSTGYTANSSRAVEAEVTKNSPSFPKTALYVKHKTTVNGDKTTIDGKNACGEGTVPAITTTLPEGESVVLNGGPSIVGPLPPAGPIKYEDTPALDVVALVNSLKPYANVPAAEPEKWGDPDKCTSYNIVHFNNDTHLSGQMQGCGLLLVDGDLEVTGGFEWRGIVIATGIIKFTGVGGNDKRVTGGMISGAGVDATVDVKIGGSTVIRYCSSVQEEIAKNLPWRFLSWRDKNQK